MRWYKERGVGLAFGVRQGINIAECPIFGVSQYVQIDFAQSSCIPRIGLLRTFKKIFANLKDKPHLECRLLPVISQQIAWALNEHKICSVRATERYRPCFF